MPAGFDGFADLSGESCNSAGIQRRLRFNFNLHVLHRLDRAQFDAELDYTVELANHVFEGGRIRVIAADRDHVVGSAEDATGEEEDVLAELRGGCRGRV